MTNFRIAVTSDTVCPWCYIGRRQLQRAQQLWLQRHPDSGDTFSITYMPYQLEPGLPRGPSSSMDKQRFFDEKFGRKRTDWMYQAVDRVGREVGIDFKHGGRTGSTRDSHRLVQLAKRYGPEVELRTVDGLFAAYFEREMDITAYDTLRTVAINAGIPEDDFREAIVDGDYGGSQVDEATKKARLEGVSGVPDFTIQGMFSLGGANDPETFVDAFERVKALEEKGEQESKD
ncbi:hypothetical protein CDD83_3416 [Cordyceps sp. RAO-2017]|nr:hypothetical protein CDD83_3416 [Cordyceps sp. RAO-2017]